MAVDKIPDVVLVKKVYAEKSLRNRRRKWKLKHMDELHQEKGSFTSTNDDYQDFLNDEVKKDIFDNYEDDELFESAIESKIPSNSGAANENQGHENEDISTSTSGYETLEVKHSNTLDDLGDDQDVFKSSIEPSAAKFNGTEPEEKDIPLDDDDEDEPQYEEEKLTVILRILLNFKYLKKKFVKSICL